jgi:hemerythrin
MSLLTWKPEFSLGIESIDDEHRQMIDMINDVYKQMLNCSEIERPELFLSDIYIAVAAHFAHEERMMVKAKYHEYKEHRADHESLLVELRDIMESYLKDPEGAQDNLRTGLTNWFTGHFSTFDARLHGQLGA